MYAVNVIGFPCPIFNPHGLLFSTFPKIDSNTKLNKIGKSASPFLTPLVTVNSSDITVVLNLILHLEFCIHAFTILTILSGIPSLTITFYSLLLIIET